MKSNFFILSALLITCLTLIMGCNKEHISPSGKQVNEIRNTQPFNGINISGSSKVHIEYGTNFRVVVSGSDNMVSSFSTTVNNSELTLGYNNNVVVKNEDITIYVTTPNIESVKTSGTSIIELFGNFPDRQSFKAVTSGAGNIFLNGTLNVNLLEVEVVGSGNVDLEKILAQSGKLKISGSGDIKTSVSDNLKAKITGSGNIYYSGSPSLETDFTGSGRVIKK